MATSLDATSAFPADWDVIAEPGPPFTFDPMHTPFPVSPLWASTQVAFETGYGTAMREVGIPLRDVKVRHVNHFRFERMVFDPPASEVAAATMEQSLQRELARMLDRWFVEHRPRLLELHARLRELAPDAATSADVATMLDEVDAIHAELWTVHFRIAGPMLLSMQLLRELHAELFGDDGAGALTLMAGSVSESIKAGFGLADLTERARQLGLADLFLSVPVEELMPALETTPAGRAFLIDLDAWLERYGLRQDLFDLATPTWREDPTVALANVRNYLESGHDPRAEHAEVARTAEEAFETARATLAGYPGAVWDQFEQAVQFARQGAFLQEEHNFYIDQTGLALLRHFYLGVGEHLRRAGVLVAADDIVMLTIDQVRALVLAPPVPGRARDLVANARDELARAATLTPPPMIGDPATFPPPGDSPMTRAMMAFFGGPPPAAGEAGTLRGVPGSRGVVSGPARIARTLGEAKALQPGEVLVALTTMPAWTPLFGVATAVVTETGGPLSHCAVVAREYGIPAVVGAHGATTAIRTGQRVTVDGGAGVVMIES